MAGADCRSRALADGSPDEPESVRSLWPALPAVAAQKIAAHSLRQRACARTGKKFCRPRNVATFSAIRRLLAKFQTDEQRADMDAIVGDVEKQACLITLPAGISRPLNTFKARALLLASFRPIPFRKASKLARFGIIFSNFKLKIHFAHRTFAWESEARGKAHVHVVIIGFGAFDTTGKTHLRLRNRKSHRHACKNISPYLVEGSDMAITNRVKTDLRRAGNGNWKQTDRRRKFSPYARQRPRIFERRTRPKNLSTPWSRQKTHQWQNAGACGLRSRAG